MPGAACAFCRIVAGEQPAHVVDADDRCLAFLDTRPLFPGHTLVVPREHHETLADLPVPLVGAVFAAAQRLARAMEDGLGAAGSFVACNNRVSQSVAHLHVHVVPRRPKDGLRGFFWPRQRYDGEEHMAEVAATLRAALAGAPGTGRGPAG
ncbi:MAG TPA: HIT family protein [Acidimicrobiales bacterium]|nr:HIT family protein [Acidimicrobiales bacterium]